MAILATNFLPAVVLWRHDEVVEWLERLQRRPATNIEPPNNETLARPRGRREAAGRQLLITCLICLITICLFLVGVLIHNQKSMPVAAPKIPPDDAEWIDIAATPVPTPIPIRRAIPVTR